MSPWRLSGEGSGRGAVKRPLIVIEHLEDHLSRWLRAEYRHAASLLGDRLVVTNAGRFCDHVSEIIGAGRCFRESVLDLDGVLYSDSTRVIILDMRAKERLAPATASRAEAIVVGGILGDHPPRGRTWSLLTRRALEKGVRAANIGSYQFSIDGAAYVAYRIAEGTPLEEIEVTINPVIEVDLGDGLVREVELPFAYPMVNGQPWMPPDLPRLLAGGLGYEEYLLLGREGGAEEDS
jgi:ribosome biogenesis SPOUT family RNA methylase Rps3